MGMLARLSCVDVRFFMAPCPQVRRCSETEKDRIVGCWDGLELHEGPDASESVRLTGLIRQNGS